MRWGLQFKKSKSPFGDASSKGKSQKLKVKTCVGDYNLKSQKLKVKTMIWEISFYIVKINRSMGLLLIVCKK